MEPEFTIQCPRCAHTDHYTLNVQGPSSGTGISSAFCKQCYKKMHILLNRGTIKRVFKNDSTKIERETFDKLKLAFDKAKESSATTSGAITIVCGDSAEFECDEITYIKGRQKADFGFCRQGNIVRFLSHKAKGFSDKGYGRLCNKTWSDNRNLALPSIVIALNWVREFCVSHCYAKKDPGGLLEWKGDFPEGIWFTPSENIEVLRCIIVYGKHYGNRESGGFNVDYSAVGDPILIPRSDGKWRLCFQDGFYRNGEIPAGEDEPVIVVKGETKPFILTMENPIQGLRANFGAFPKRVVTTKNRKRRGCVHVEYPSGRILPD
jgi:hypothetical protein